MQPWFVAPNRAYHRRTTSSLSGRLITGAPLLLSDNLFNVRAYPTAIVSANEEEAGHEAANVGDGRRSQFDYWTPTTLNAAAQVVADASSGVTFAPTCVAIDRGHNLSGKAIIVSGADDSAFTVNNVTVVSATIPSTVSAGASIDAANGALTEEGAWIKRFALPTPKRFWRLNVPAMGVGLKPVVVGLWLGRSYDPAAFFTPSSAEGAELHVPTRLSEWGWRGRGPAAPIRSGTINLRFGTTAEYEAARPTLMLQYLRGRTMWICYDTAQAERTFLAICPEEARLAPSFEPGWFPQQIHVPYVEHSPLRVA